MTIAPLSTITSRKKNKNVYDDTSTDDHQGHVLSSTTEKLQSSAREFMKSLEDVIMLSGTSAAATTTHHSTQHSHRADDQTKNWSSKYNYVVDQSGNGSSRNGGSTSAFLTTSFSSTTTATSSGDDIGGATSTSAQNTSSNNNTTFLLRDGAATIEQAFRSIFISCTHGAESAIIPDDQSVQEENKKQHHQHRSRSQKQKQQHLKKENDEFPMDPSRPVTPSTAPFLLARMTNAATIATNAAAGTISTAAGGNGRRSPVQMLSSSTIPAVQQQHRDIGDHIYAQLFLDEQDRAMRAVDVVRDQHDYYDSNQVHIQGESRLPMVETQINNINNSTTTNVNTNQASPIKDTHRSLFPRSTPAAVEASRLFLTAPRTTTLMSSSATNDAPTSFHNSITPLSSDELHIPNTMTFDDGISAISAHTLEAIAMVTTNQSGRVRSDLTRSSQESSIFPSATSSPVPILEHQLQEESEDLVNASGTAVMMVQGSPTRSSKNGSPTTGSPFLSRHDDSSNHHGIQNGTIMTSTMLGATRSPFSVRHISPIPRVDSHHTWGGSSHGGKNSISPTKDSRSTHTTHNESSAGESFEMWRQEEKKYWSHMVTNQQQQQQTPTTSTTASDSRSSILMSKFNNSFGKRRLRKGGNNDSRTHDQTLSTSSISALSTWSSSHNDHRHHPHDPITMIPIEPLDIQMVSHHHHHSSDYYMMDPATSEIQLDFPCLSQHVGDDFLLPEGTDMGEI